MPTYTLADLGVPESAATIRARLVASLAAKGLPTAAWAPTAAGGVENAVLDAIAGAHARFAAGLPPLFLAVGLVVRATGAVLTYRAKHYYQLDRDEATKTRQTIRLTSTPEAPPFTLEPGDIVVQGLTGNAYVSIDGGLLQSGAGTDGGPPPLFVTVEAVDAGAAFNDGDAQIDSSTNPNAMITPLPGVSAINAPATDFTEPKLLGSSAGALSANFTIPEAGPAQGIDVIRVRIDVAGDVGTGAFSYTVDGGSNWLSGGALASSAALAGGTTVHFANAPGVSPSFLRNDTWAFAVAHAIVQQGHDEESDAALIRRCTFRWPALGEVPTEAKMTLWAHRASPEVGKIIADADPDFPGQTLVVISGVAGTVGGSTAATVQDFINARLNGYVGLSIQETALVVAATERPITAGGLVQVKRNLLAGVRIQAEKNWRAYLASVGIAGRVYRAELVQAIMDAGAIEVGGPITLNGTTADYVQLGAREVAVEAPGTSLITSLGWVPI